MNPVSESLWPASVFSFALGLGTKATAVLVCVLVIQKVVGRPQALLGSAVGNAGLIGLLLLPFSALVLPSVPVACLPADMSKTGARVAVEPNPPAAIAVGRDFLGQTPPAIVPRTDGDPPSPTKPIRIPASAPFGIASTPRTDWRAIAIVGYGLIALVLIARLVASLRAIARLRHSCVKVDDPEWIAALECWRERLGIVRPVFLAWSPLVNVPLALGWLRPTIVLPDSWRDEPSRGYAGAVLLHELAHVRRGDYPWNIVLRFIQALYWPHALVWLLGRAIAALRERACDDLCVYELGGPGRVSRDTTGCGGRPDPPRQRGVGDCDGRDVAARAAAGADRREFWQCANACRDGLRGSRSPRWRLLCLLPWGRSTWFEPTRRLTRLRPRESKATGTRSMIGRSRRTRVSFWCRSRRA